MTDHDWALLSAFAIFLSGALLMKAVDDHRVCVARARLHKALAQQGVLTKELVLERGVIATMRRERRDKYGELSASKQEG